MTSRDHPVPSILGLGLVVNAGMSLATGALLSSVPTIVGGWLGVHVDGWLRLLGLALLGHAVVLVAARDRPRPLGLLNLAVIAPYPLLMIGVVGFGLVDTSLGRALVLLDGLAVGAVAVVQAVGLRRIRTPAMAR